MNQYRGFFGGWVGFHESQRAPNPLICLTVSEGRSVTSNRFPSSAYLTYEDAVALRDSLTEVIARHPDAPGFMMKEAWHDPVAFVERYIDIKDPYYEYLETGSLTDYQKTAMRGVAGKGRLAMYGPHGMGSTATAALLVLWFAITREIAQRDWQVVTTAGKWDHLENFLWPEIHKWASRIRWDLLPLKPFESKELMSLNLILEHGRAFAMSSTVPEYIEAVCADCTLFIFDSAAGIPDDAFDAMDAVLAVNGGMALAAGTPNTPEGRFYEICSGSEGFRDWEVVPVTTDMCVATQRIDQAWVTARQVAWGAESALFRNRVKGEFA